MDNMKNTQKDIAKKFGISESTVSLLITGLRYTKDADLALELARYTGQRGVTFINPKYRETYAKAYPRLKK